MVARASVVDFDSGREVREELGLREKKAAVENQLWPDKHRPRDITGLAVHVKKVLAVCLCVGGWGGEEWVSGWVMGCVGGWVRARERVRYCSELREKKVMNSK